VIFASLSEIKNAKSAYTEKTFAEVSKKLATDLKIFLLNHKIT